jgi:putative acetyltransferase
MSATQSTFAKTPEPPYYAVIFTSQRNEEDRGYGQMAERMVQLAAGQPGFLGVETARSVDGFGITVSYWTSEEAIADWKAHLDHKPAQEAGKRIWYADYHLRVAKVERAYGKAQSVAQERGELRIETDDLSGPEIANLLTEHLRTLYEVTPLKSRHALNLQELRRPGITFWSVWLDRRLVGCGALKELDPEHGEIKSMRTAGAYLRKGVASALLTHLIKEAKRRGYRKLSLETGVMSYFQPAHHLYRKFGFAPCGPFGEYVEDPNSLFMSRAL